MSRLSSFLNGAPDGTAATLAALACAESLTDQVALAICKMVPVPGLSPEDFVVGFKYCGLTEPRNSEWNLAPALREELVEPKLLPESAGRAVHRYLLSLGQAEANRQRAGSEIPSYLFTKAGQAYHLAGVGEVESALQHYSAASQGPFNGAQWLGAKLAAEQERSRVIPEGAVETTFLRAWVLLRQGRRNEAMPLFRKVAVTDRLMREVAISLHIVGNHDSHGQRVQAERELRRSIEIDDNLGNEFGVAQTLHSLANLLSKQDRRLTEAEGIYRRSIEIGVRFGNDFHVAQTLHSLANLLSKQDGRLTEAEEVYRRSIEIGVRFGNDFHVAQTLHSLANLLSKQDGRHTEAEEVYRRSIEIGGRLGNSFHVAQTLHSLANLLSKQDGRLTEAVEAYKKSLSLGGNDKHMAQVLRSYGLAIEGHSPEEALLLLQRSLDIDRRQGNIRFVSLLERDIRRIKERMARG